MFVSRSFLDTWDKLKWDKQTVLFMFQFVYKQFFFWSKILFSMCHFSDKSWCCSYILHKQWNEYFSLHLREAIFTTSWPIRGLQSLLIMSGGCCMVYRLSWVSSYCSQWTGTAAHCTAQYNAVQHSTVQWSVTTKRFLPWSQYLV